MESDQCTAANGLAATELQQLRMSRTAEDDEGISRRPLGAGIISAGSPEESKPGAGDKKFELLRVAARSALRYAQVQNDGGLQRIDFGGFVYRH